MFNLNSCILLTVIGVSSHVSLEHGYKRQTDLKSVEPMRAVNSLGKTKHRITVPIINEKEKQTYHGAIDLQTHELLV